MQIILQRAGVPETSKQLFARLMQEDLIPVEALSSVVESYRRVIADAARKNGRANSPLGNKIADALQVLLGRVSERTGEENMRILQAAVRYFVIQNDGVGHDLDSAEGLFDDARIINAVLWFYGRDELQVPVPEPVANRAPPPKKR